MKGFVLRKKMTQGSKYIISQSYMKGASSGYFTLGQIKENNKFSCLGREVTVKITFSGMAEYRTEERWLCGILEKGTEEN